MVPMALVATRVQKTHRKPDLPSRVRALACITMATVAHQPCRQPVNATPNPVMGEAYHPRIRMNARLNTALRHIALASTVTALLWAAPAHADKKSLIQKAVAAQQGSLDELARSLVEQPARQMGALTRQVVGQAVPADKQEATFKQVDAELKKYVDGALPLAKASANKAGKVVLTDMLDKQFSEPELTELVNILESKVLKKYQGMMPELTNALTEKVATDARPAITPKVQAAEAAVKKILDTASNGKFSAMLQQAAAAHAAQASGPAPAAAPAKK